MIFAFLFLTSLSVLISGSIHVAADGMISFFLMAGQYSLLDMDHIFFHCSVDGHSGGFHVSWLL